MDYAKLSALVYDGLNSIAELKEQDIITENEEPRELMVRLESRIKSFSDT